MSGAQEGTGPGRNAAQAAKTLKPAKTAKIKAAPEEVAASTWLTTVTSTLDVDPQVLRATIKDVLDLTSIVAHEHSRPAAPVTAFLAGLTAGQRAAGGTHAEQIEAIQQHLAHLAVLARGTR